MRARFHLLAYLPLAVLQALGALAGWLSWISNSARRRVALRNLERCMPELGGAERKRMARAALAHEFMTYIETIRVWLGPARAIRGAVKERSEEHTSELPSLMRISYAVFCLKKKNKKHTIHAT